jgi:hypothetical protein
MFVLLKNSAKSVDFGNCFCRWTTVLVVYLLLALLLNIGVNADLTSGERSRLMVGSRVDVAKFAFVRTWKGQEISYPEGVHLQKFEDVPRLENGWIVEAEPGESSVNIGLEWGEPRQVKLLAFIFADQDVLPSADSQKLEVWLDCSDNEKGRNKPLRGGRTPSQGRWYALASEDQFSARLEGSTWVYELPPVEGGFFKVRLTVTGQQSLSVSEIHAFVDSVYKDVEFEVQFDPARQKPQNIVEGYNAEVLSVTPLSGVDGYRVKAVASDAGDESNDRAIFTIREGNRSFSFLMNDLERDKVIYVKPFGVRVLLPGAEHHVATGATIIERVLNMPEQTYTNALNAVPPKERNKWLALAPPLNKRKWAIEPNGNAFSREEQDFIYQWATGDNPDFERRKSQRVESDYLPILYSEWDENGLHWQIGYVTASIGKFDDPTAETALVMRATARNDSTTPVEAKLWLRLHGGGKHVISRQNDVILDDSQVRGLLDADGWDTKLMDDRILFTATIPPGSTRSVEFEALWPTATKVPPRVTFDEARRQNIDYWNAKLAEGAQFSVPDERINRIWKSLLIHQYTWGDYDEKTNTYLPNVAAFVYGPVGNESSQMAKALDFFGHYKLAENYYEPMWKHQGTNKLSARVTNGKGALVGWWTGYVFNTGFILWNLCNHYWLTGDRQWLEKIIPNMIKACDWLAEQRRTTIGRDANGNLLIESGFFPPCGLEDEDRWFYWVMTNGYFYLGMASVANVLTEIGHPDAKRIAEEAKAYLSDLHRGIGEATIRCPVVKLRDGTYVPYIPPHLYARGRYSGHYEAELGALHLLTTHVYEPYSPQIDWTLAFHEDVVYMTEAPSHDSIVDYSRIEEDWFNLGGYGKTQPYLVHTQVAYLRRDQPKLFLRSFFNQLVAQNFSDINAFPEHICWNGAADCKTYEEAMWLQQFRCMLILDEDGKLRLSVGTPREYFEDGKVIRVKDAPTFYGSVSFEIKSSVSTGKIFAQVEFDPRRQPKSFDIRFRHPQELKMKSVMVNGKPWDGFDPERETIELPTVGGKFEIVAEY